MSDLIDIRPQRILTEVREHGDLEKAFTSSGMTADEVGDLLVISPNFGVAVIECCLEHAEEFMRAQAEKTIQGVRTMLEMDITAMRKNAHASHTSAENPTEPPEVA